jgi:hypothetical protein
LFPLSFARKANAATIEIVEAFVCQIASNEAMATTGVDLNVICDDQ